MTADVRAGELVGATTDPAVHGSGTILSLCDSMLGERGRRDHLFSWLKAPGAGALEWLPVDAYYPRHRLILVYRASAGGHEQIYREMAPTHGLRLLMLDPEALGSERAGVEGELRRMIDGLNLPPAGSQAHVTGSTKVGGPKPAGSREREQRTPGPLWPASLPAPTPSRRHPAGGAQAIAAERAARFVAAHKPVTASGRPVPATARPVPATTRPVAPVPATARPTAHQRPAKRPVRRRRVTEPAAEAQTIGAVIGLALAGVLAVEAYLGVAKVAFAWGHVVLGFAIALDACARALGTIAAERGGEHGWAWGTAIGGSPVVAGFALFRRSGPVAIEPAPLAGLVALLACLAVVLAVAGAMLGL